MSSVRARSRLNPFWIHSTLQWLTHNLEVENEADGRGPLLFLQNSVKEFKCMKTWDFVFSLPLVNSAGKVT